MRFKTILLYAGIALAALVLLIWIGSAAYSAWQGHQFQKKTEQFQMVLTKPYREDTYGGKTPEETWAMFLDALKKEDLELASKYFVPEKQEEWKKNLISTNQKSKLSTAIKNIEKIEFDSSTPETSYFFYNIKDENSGVYYKNSVIFILNPYTKVWKISLL